MAFYLRRLVSGHKARFRDDHLHLELDLAYVTDRIVVMGFPARGLESIYRNHRADVQRFLAARHGPDFWVFNCCPLTENAYHESVFQGRVSRYPFPDHHVPPFLYFPLVSREILAWLSASDNRVAVLHCKAGKGRSGTLACAYLLSRYASHSVSVPPFLHECPTSWFLVGEKEGLQTPSKDASTALSATAAHPSARPSLPLGTDLSRALSEPMLDTLEKVLDLHTSRRMKPSLHPSRHRPDVPLPKKPKMGVSIPSQRRWLLYWSQVLDGKGPPSFSLATDHPEIPPGGTPQTTKVKLTKLTIRMREPSRLQPHLVQAASVIITSVGKGCTNESTAGRLWASLARYSDQLVDELQRWEKDSRGATGTRESSPFKSDRWDKAKMVRNFAQMSISDVLSTQEDGNNRPVLTYVLRPSDGIEEDWVNLRQPGPESNCESLRPGTSGSPQPDEVLEGSSGVLLDADRELRIKLFMGEVVLGWVWLIPAFHISPDSASSNLVFSSDDIDFVIGIGRALVDMKISITSHV